MRGRSPVLLVAALAPASLLAVDPWGWYPFGPIKWLAVSVLVTAGSLVVLARRPSRFAVGPTVVALSLVAWLAVAAVVGADPVYAWVGTPERHLGIVTWALAVLALVVGQSLDGDSDRRVVAGGLVVAGLGVGAIAVAEALGWEPDALDTGTRLSGTLGSPAYLGAAAALLLPALVGVTADETWARRSRVAAAAGAAGLAVALVGSGARAAWVGLAVAGIVAAWVHRTRLGRRPRIVLLAVAVAGVATAALVTVGPVGDRVASTFDAGEPGGGGRVDEWRVAGRVIADHPFVGVGPEGYRVAFAEGADAAYEQEHGRVPLPDRAHSTPLDVALAGGLPVLAAWLALVVLVGRAAFVALRGDRLWLAGIAAGLVAHTVGGLFLFPVVELEPMVWLLAGLVLGAAPTTARVVGPRIVERPTPRPGLAVVGLAAVVALVAGAADVAADRHARRAADALAARRRRHGGRRGERGDAAAAGRGAPPSARGPGPGGRRSGDRGRARGGRRRAGDLAW